MNWEAAGAIGEIAGAIAVVLTLGYLAVQIRNSTKASMSATRQAISDTIMLPAMNFVQNAEFRRAFNAHIDGEELDSDQLLQIESYCYINLRMFENIHFQHRNGMLSDSEWAAFRRNLKAFSQVPMMRGNWEKESYVYTEEFKKEMESIFSELDTEPRVVAKSVIHPASERDA
jgi:hypothetical protein